MNNIICFHNPDEENGYLSNWYLSDFMYNGIKFTSMEQFMMYYKAVEFNDLAIAGKILKTSDVSKIKRLGREVHNFNESVWDLVRCYIVIEGLKAKFMCNQTLLQSLLSTGDALLVECAVKDRIWGAGISMTDPNRFNPECWKGQNLLGKCLMVAREHLRN